MPSAAKQLEQMLIDLDARVRDLEQRVDQLDPTNANNLLVEIESMKVWLNSHGQTLGDLQTRLSELEVAIQIGFGIIIGSTETPSNGTPVIESLSSATWKAGETGIQINGSGFGSVPGNVRLSVQGRDQNDTITANMTIVAWTPEKITLTAVMPQFGVVDWPGYFDGSVIHDNGAESNSKQILIGPIQTTIAAQHASGFVELPDSGDPQTIIDAEAAGSPTAGVAYLITGNHIGRTITPQGADYYVASPGASMDGSKDIGTGWTVSGSNWKKTGQTQADSDLGTSFTIETWDPENSRQADYFIGLSAQDQSRLPRIRRYGGTTALAAADSTGSLTNPFTTTNGSKLVWVADTAHGLGFGECVRFEDASASGGITINGFYTVLETEANRYLIEHEAAATSAATGGGTVSRTYGIGVFFDSANDGVYINIDPTEAGLSIRASDTEKAFNITVANCVLRGADDDNKFEIMRFAAKSNRGTIWMDPANNVGGSKFQFLHAHHHHGGGMKNATGTGAVNEWWDCEFTYGAHHGFIGRGGDSTNDLGLVLRRILCQFNTTADYTNGFAGGFKLAHIDDIDIDQASVGYNHGTGAWFDSKCNLVAAGARRIDAYNNSDQGIFYELNDNTVGSNHGDIKNCLARDNGRDFTAYNAIQPAQIQLLDCKGSATRKIRATGNVVEVPDHPDKGPMNGIMVGTDTRSVNSEFNEVTGNRIVYKGVTQGIPGTGFMSFGGVSAGETTAMKANAVFDTNEYHHTGPSTDKIFGKSNAGNDNPSATWSSWQSDGWDAASTITFDEASPALSGHPKGTMPAWADVKAA